MYGSNSFPHKLQVNKTRVHSCKLAKGSTHNSNASNNSFTTRAQVNNYNSKFISSCNCHANLLIKYNTALASQIQSQNFNCNSTANPLQKAHHITMSANESSQSRSLPTNTTSNVSYPLNPYNEYMCEQQQHSGLIFTRKS